MSNFAFDQRPNTTVMIQCHMSTKKYTSSQPAPLGDFHLLQTSVPILVIALCWFGIHADALFCLCHSRRTSQARQSLLNSRQSRIFHVTKRWGGASQ